MGGYATHWIVVEAIPKGQRDRPRHQDRYGTAQGGEAPQVGRPHRDRRKQAARRRAARASRGRR